MYGKEIKNQRKAFGYTQVELSKATGLSQSTISWLESDSGIPNIQQCVILSDFYGISIDELIGRENIKPSAIIFDNGAK